MPAAVVEDGTVTPKFRQGKISPPLLTAKISPRNSPVAKFPPPPCMVEGRPSRTESHSYRQTWMSRSSLRHSENGPFWDQQWVKNGSKTRFSKNDPGPFMMLKQVVLAHLEPVATGFGTWKIPKCLENGPFWDQKWVKNGSKTRFSKSDPGPFGMLKQVFLARFEPVLTEFSPFHHIYTPRCALRTYFRAVWWSHLELGEGCRLEDIYIYIYILLHPSPLESS